MKSGVSGVFWLVKRVWVGGGVRNLVLLVKSDFIFKEIVYCLLNKSV